MKSTLIGALMGGTALLGAAPLGETTFTPNIFDDPAPVAAPNGCTGAGPSPTRCSLREAVLSANATAVANTIQLAEGTYNLTIPEAGSPESGDLDIGDGNTGLITFQGAGSDKTIINAGPALAERIIQINVLEGSLTLTGITFQNGQAVGPGGAIYASTGNGTGPNDPITINDCKFLNNHATSDGGGVYLSGSKPLINIDGATFEGNSADTSAGGAYLSGGNPDLATFLSNIVLTNNQALNGNGGGMIQNGQKGFELNGFEATGNKALNGEGGAIYASSAGAPDVVNFLLVDGVIQGNQAGNNGGGASFITVGSIVLQDLSVSDNSTDGTSAFGGGAYVSCGSDIEISNSTFANNQITVSGNGGGVYASNGRSIKITGSTVSGNSTADGNGGGIYHTGPGGEDGEFTNSTVSGNEATVEGGGIYVQHPGLSLNNVTIAENIGGDGGGVFAAGGGTHILRNSIFSANDSSSDSDDCGGSFFNSQGFNIWGSNANTNCQPDGFPVGNNPDDIVGDPLIGPLQDNGGPTQTRNLLAGSPAIDGGNPAGCKDGSGTTLSVDQRGFPRPSGPVCDIGAVEAVVSDLSILKTADGNSFIVGDEIAYTLTVTNDGPSLSPALVSDTLPAGVTLVSVSANCAESAGTVTCDLGTLDAGQSQAVEIVVEAVQDGSIVNTATVSGADVDTDPAGNSSSVTVNVLSNNPDDNGGCSLGASSTPSALSWGFLLLGLGGAMMLRRQPDRSSLPK